MQELLRKHHISFKNAWAGLMWSFRVHPNFRIHFSISVLVLLLSWFFQISRLELIIIIFTIILGLSAEMINTSIESMTDLITKEWREEARIAKDVSAGMTLLVAIGASIVGFLIFFPYIFFDFI